MPIIVVEVMPKAEILDPQGKAVAGALTRLGHTQFSGVRIGKRFELTVDGPVTPEVLAAAQTVAEEILSNQVIEDVVSIVEWRLFVIKWWESHSLEVAAIALLTSHHNPHSAPLSYIYRLGHPRDLINETDGPSDMI